MQKDHDDQVIDTEVPDGKTVDMATWETMRDEALKAEEAATFELDEDASSKTEEEFS